MIKVVGYILIIIGIIDIISSWTYKDLTYEYLGDFSQYSAYFIITIGSFYQWLHEQIKKNNKLAEYSNLLKVAVVAFPLSVFLYFLGNENNSSMKKVLINIQKEIIKKP